MRIGSHCDADGRVCSCKSGRPINTRYMGDATWRMERHDCACYRCGTMVTAYVEPQAGIG